MRSRVRFVCALLLLATVFGGLGIQPALAATQGSGRWYWPTGSEDFGGMGPWWQSRGGDTRHLAQDMASPCGSPVYAVGAGTVLESKYVGGYGPGGTSGGAVVILHRTATGQEFKALYGHLKSLRFKQGDTVAAGAVIGLVNGSSPNHVHFGIHPGRAYPSDNNPYRGHTYDSSVTYGWVDPVAFLRRNPRYIPYVAPPTPVVLSLATTSTPLSPVAASGRVWWLERTAETTATWCYSLRDRKLASAEQTPPASDLRSYAVAINTQKPAIVVRDLRTIVSRRVLHTTPQRGAPAVLTGTVSNVKGVRFQGARLALERWSGSAWVRVGWAITGADGVYRASYAPGVTSKLRLRFAPPAPYAGAVSPAVTVAPHVAISRPALSATTPAHGVAFRVTSALTPRHTTSSIVEFQLERKVSGSWVRISTTRARLTDVTSGSTCAASLACTRTGDWRVRAYMPSDAAHAATSSLWTGFSVR